MAIKVFLDANIYFAGADSPGGGSGLLLSLAKSKQLKVVTILQVLLEAERNINKKCETIALRRHYQNILEIKPDIEIMQEITEGESKLLKLMLPQKDIPVLLGAIQSGAPYFITLDKKHFLQNERLQKLDLPFKIVTPGEFIQMFLDKKKIR